MDTACDLGRDQWFGFGLVHFVKVLGCVKICTLAEFNNCINNNVFLLFCFISFLLLVVLEFPAFSLMNLEYSSPLKEIQNRSTQ